MSSDRRLELVRPRPSGSSSPPVSSSLAVSQRSTLGSNQPVYAAARHAHRAHSKQVHYPNGSLVGEGDLVRPLYARGGDTFDLVASIYFVNYGERFSHGTAIDEQGEEDSALAERPTEPEWQRLFSKPVLRDLDGTAAVNTVVKVVLPAPVARVLSAGEGDFELTAKFHLIPSSPDYPWDVVNTTNYLGGTDIRNVYIVDRSASLLPYPAYGRNVSAQRRSGQPWESRIPGSEPSSLLRMIDPYTPGPPPVSAQQDEADDLSEDTDELDEDVNAEDASEQDDKSGRAYPYWVLTLRSMVTLIDKSPVYSLPRFKGKMRASKKRAINCSKGQRPWMTCLRSYASLGHFENLLQVARASTNGTRDDKNVGWRYPPYLHVQDKQIGPRDYVKVPVYAGQGDGPDFAFDWRVSFSPISPVKAALAEAYTSRNRENNDRLFGDGGTVWAQGGQWAADAQDIAELFNALSGHHPSTSARPILRFLLLRLGKYASLASTCLGAYFWYSRLLTTGISLPAYAIHTGCLFATFAHSLVKWGLAAEWHKAPGVLFMVVIDWGLCARLEWIGGGPDGLMLVGVRRRRATKGERASAREDGKFTWLMRAALWIAALLLLTLALPLLAPIIASGRSRSQKVDTRVSLPVFLRVFHPLIKASSIHLVASQLHLNHRLRTFGGSYRLVAWLDFAAGVSKDLPFVLSGSWGLWETMPAFEWLDVLSIVGKAALAWQAWEYPKVEQTEPEEE